MDGNKKSLIRRIGWLLAAVLLLVSGCGPREAAQGSEQEQEIEIFYRADDGEFGLGTDWGNKPAEENASEKENSSEKENTADVEKTVITLAMASDHKENEVSVLEELAAQFNQDNEKYRVELRTCRYGEELRTLRDRISVEIGAGGGPDLLTNQVFRVSQEIMDSGILVDLAPYLEKSGITPEKYFPAYAAAVSGERIYGVCTGCTVIGYSVDAEVLGDREPPEDLKSLVDILYEYPGQGSFLGRMTGGRYILAYFLDGSEDLWGMVDWEEKTCDFEDPFFSRLLELVRRYREDGKKGYEPVVHNYVVYMQMPLAMSISSSCPESIPIGFYFDDGPHYKYQVNGDALMINGNTEHLEGAYAFVSYALSKTGQNFSSQPVNKEVWDSYYQYYLDLLELGNPRVLPLNEETRKETLEAYEDARYAPRRAEEILEIVYEVSESYFEGDKSKEEVIDLIQNRVQLYLNEQG